jgi:hypothetical protein
MLTPKFKLSRFILSLPSTRAGSQVVLMERRVE